MRSAMARIAKALAALRPRRRPRYRVLPPEVGRRLVLAYGCLEGLRECLAPEIEKRHEGIAYLYGQTDGSTTVAVGAIRPVARTTAGSFEVSSIAMARVVRVVSDLGLQVVGQAHSHPHLAHHSDGDEEGARIAYQGFVSLVAPEYGRHLPSVDGCAVYFFDKGRFVDLPSHAVTIVPGAVR